MRWVIARVFPVPAPARTQTGPVRASATSRWSGSRASRISSADIAVILAAQTDTRRRARSAGGCVMVRPHDSSKRSGGRQTRWVPTPVRRILMSLADLSLPAPGTVTMFSTASCGYCRRLKTYLEVEQIAYREVNVEESPDAVAFVEEANGGSHLSLIHISEPTRLGMISYAV